MSANDQKELAEFLATFEAAYPYLSATDKTALVKLASTWASRGIAEREAAGKQPDRVPGATV